MNKLRFLSKFFFIQIIIIIILSTSLYAAEKIAYISSVKGEVRLKSEARKRHGKWLRIKKAGVRVFSGDQFKVMSGRVEITFDDGSSLLAMDNSSFSIDERPNMLEEFLPSTTVLELAKKWYTHRNITIKYGVIMADIIDAGEKWTSFETKSSFVGMIAATISIKIDTFGNTQFSCKSGFAEVRNHNGLLKFDIESGKEVRIERTDNNETEVQSIKGDILVKAGFTKTGLGINAGVLIGNRSLNGILIAALKSNRGPIKMAAGNKKAILDSGDALIIRKNKTGELSFKAEKGYVDITSNGTKTVLKEGEVFGVVDSIDEGLEELSEPLTQAAKTLQTEVLETGNIKIGSTELRLYEAVSLKYDDNIFLVSGNVERKISDKIIIFSPGVEIKKENNDNLLLFNYHADLLNYQDNPKESRQDHKARLLSDLRFEGGLLLMLKYDYLDTAEPATSELTTIDERIQNTINISAGVNFKNNMTFKLNFQGIKHDYDKPTRHYMNREQQLIGSEISFTFLPKTSFFLEYNNTSIEYDTVVNNSGTNNYIVGLRGDLTSKLFINAKLGYSGKKYDQQGKKGFNGSVMDVSLTNKYSESTKISLSGHRKLVESFYRNNNFYVENKIACSLVYAVNNKFTSQFNGFYSINEYKVSSVDLDGSNDKRSDDMIGVGIDIIYKIQPWLSTAIKYTFTGRDSNFYNEDYDNNQLLLTVKAEI